ncbi:hypothetical protein MKL26_06035 [Streptococcus suis]|nr:hypothetical protein [Streptococcus suis]
MKRQSVRVELFPLKKEEILVYLDDKGVLVNDYFKTYLAHTAYQAVEEQQECLVEIVSLVDMRFDSEKIKMDRNPYLKGDFGPFFIR